MRKILFAVGLALQVLLIGIVALPQMMLLKYGSVITLKTIPVDPRSIFRGDYVILSYEAGRLDGGDDYYNSTPVFVVLEKQGDVYVRKGEPTETKPMLQAGVFCLKGVRQWNQINFSSIAQYFVPEGLGHELENAQREHNLLVDIAVDNSCNATIKGVRLGAELPDALPTLDGSGVMIQPVPTDPPVQ